MTTPGPTMRRKHLAQALRELREQAGMTMESVATALDLSRSAIGHFETGRNIPSLPVLEALLRLYGVYQEKFGPLDQLRREAKKPGWWSTYRLPPWLQAYVGMEDEATVVRSFALELAPGLLQTESYARAAHEGYGHAPEEIERRITARLRRQRRLTEGSLTLSVVASEALLRRTYEDGDEGIEQLRHIAATAKLPNVDFRILPFSAGRHRSRAGSFTLLSFAPGVSPDIAYQEYAVGGHLVDDQDVVRQLSSLYDELRDQARSTSESLSMISELTR